MSSLSCAMRVLSWFCGSPQASHRPLALRSQLVPFLVNRVPNVEQREKGGLRIEELLVGRSRRFLLFQRTLAGILNAQPGGNDQQFSGGIFVLRLEQHASERGINGHAKELPIQPTGWPPSFGRRWHPG